MAENSYEQIDDLFAQFRLRLLEIRQSNPETVESLKSLVSQLEDCVERLVIDSIKLKSLENKTGMTSKPKKNRQSRPKPRIHPPID